MANYALVEDGEIKDVVDSLPVTWRNVSNFYTFENQLEVLKTFGWVEVVKADVSINPHTQVLSAPTFSIMEDGRVLQTQTAVDKVHVQPAIPTDADKLFLIRKQRNALMDAVSFKYERYARRERLGLEQIDRLEDLDAYMQALADITTTDIDAVVWPTYTPSAPQ